MTAVRTERQLPRFSRQDIASIVLRRFWQENSLNSEVERATDSASEAEALSIS